MANSSNSIIDGFTFDDLYFLHYQWYVYNYYQNKPTLSELPGGPWVGGQLIPSGIPTVKGAKSTSGLRNLDGTDQQLWDIPQSPSQTGSLVISSPTDLRYRAGATGTLFAHLTAPAWFSKTGGFKINFGPTQQIDSATIASGAPYYDAAYGIDYSIRGNTIYDANPRLISNLVSSQTGKAAIDILDNPFSKEWTQDGTQAGRRVSKNSNTRHEVILTADNPLANSGYFALFGQYNDHGLDFLDKGVDGAVLIPLLKGDPLYKDGSSTNFMALSRGNTVRVVFGEGSNDVLLTDLGLTSQTGGTWDVDNENAVNGVNFSTLTSSVLASGGNLLLNNQIITIADNSTLQNVINAFNAKAPFTGVVASDVLGALKLTPRSGESFNFTSAFVDLNQLYGSTYSHGIFLREYNTDGTLTGAVLHGAAVNGRDTIARWTDLKANALKINGGNGYGLVIHDIDATKVPLVERIPIGATNAGKLAFVALNKSTGVKEYYFDTALVPNSSELVPSGSAFMIDLAHGWDANGFKTSGDLKGDLNDPTILNVHCVGGDGRANENLGLTSLHEIFEATHNSILKQLQADLAAKASGLDTAIATQNFGGGGEELFELAKLATEQFYQHHVFQEYARRITPDLAAFGGVSAGFNPSILKEFSVAAFRMGHSQLTEVMAMTGVDPTTGLANGVDKSLNLLNAFLSPGLYTGTTAAEIAVGMSNQVGNGTDEYLTNTLQNALVGLPLDLAALNIARAQDAGLTSLNQARLEMQKFLLDNSANQTNSGLDAQLVAQAAQLRPYVSWRDFGNHLLHADSLKGFIMAYARDAILTTYAGNSDLLYWNNLQASTSAADATKYANALSGAASIAMADSTFMGDAWAGGTTDARITTGTNAYQVVSGNEDFKNISLWLGGLAEAKVPGGMLGPTHNFIYSYQLQHLQRGDEIYYLSKLAGTQLLTSMQQKTLADMVMEAIDVRHLYHKVFAVNDADIELSTVSAAAPGSKTVLDINGLARTVGTAGVVGGVFTGNAGNYLDARGVFSPNGAGNASEMFGGTEGADSVNGLGGDDCFWGDGGNDTGSGGLGNDFLDGGADNDLLFGDAGNDLLRGANGNDELHGGADNDDLYGGAGNDLLFGEAGNDDMNGEAGQDKLVGAEGTDTMTGGEDDDTFIGGAGADTQSGNAGADLFVFDQVPVNGTVDTIRDFSSGVDALVLSTGAFNGLLADTNGRLVSSQFALSGAVGATTRIFYNATTGALSYDADGSGATAAIQFATLSKFNPNLPSDVASANAIFPTLLNTDIRLSTLLASTPTYSLAEDTGTSAVDGVTKDGRINVSNLDAYSMWDYSTNGGSGWTAGQGSSFILAAGDYAAGQLKIRQTSLVGGDSVTTTSTAMLKVDQVASSAPGLALQSDTGVSLSDGISKVGVVSVSGLEDGASWRFSVNGGTTWNNGTGSSFTLVAGAYDVDTIQVQQTDLPGNHSPIGKNSTAFTIDQTGPTPLTLALFTDTGVSNTDRITQLGAVVVSGIEANCIWEYSIMGGAWNLGSGNSFSLAPGQYATGEIQLRQSDVAGNLTQSSNPARITVDVMAPSLNDISVSGLVVMLSFAEAIASTGLPPASAFSVQTVGATVINRNVTTVAIDPFDSKRLLLTLSGSAPSSNEDVRVSYVDPAGDQSSSVVQDQAGNDLSTITKRYANNFVSSTTVSSLGFNYDNLALSGTGNINGAGNIDGNIITGNSGNNNLNGGDGSDTLTGGLGADIFTFAGVAGNTFTNKDTITDFQVGIDKLAFSKTVYSGFASSATTVSTAQFTSSSSFSGIFANSTQRFGYNTNTGVLCFDRDGSGTTYGVQQVALLGVSSHPGITNTSFALFA